MSSLSETDFRFLPIAEMEARVSRFEEQVRAAQLSASPSAELVARAVRRRNAHRCPVWLRRVTPDLIIRHGQALIDLFIEFPDDLGRLAPYDLFFGHNASKQFSLTEALMTNAEWVNEWGVGWRHVIGGVGAIVVSHPLKDWSQLDEYLEVRFPNPSDPQRLESACVAAKALRHAGRYSFGLFGEAFFGVFNLRGMENALMDFHTNKDEMHRLVVAFLNYSMELVRGWKTVGVDALLVTDDWGTQESLLISPAMWREFFKPGYKLLFDEIHRCGMDVILHSCGNVTSIIEDLIEIGLDVLDPIQTSAMDIEELGRRFGGRISFCGSIDVQRLLPSAKPMEIKDAIRRSVDVLGRPFGNGLILAPTNTITPEVPIENLRAMFEACHEQ